MIASGLEKKETALAVIGLGYVGLPLALAFARKIKVIGFDIDERRLKLLNQNIDPSGELESEAFDGCDIQFTSDKSLLANASFFVVTVPTPVDQFKIPDLGPLKSATDTVASALKKGDYVVYESTVYPGTTEEVCLPILEQVSGLKADRDFSYGYSPERINPGDKVHTVEETIKIVSGNNDQALEEIAKVYEMVVRPGVHRAPQIKVAEAAKVFENTQRDINIGLVNELSKIMDLMNVNTYDVLEAAGTKWNFLKFYPGLVGGHCIGVDPYYLTHKARSLGFHPMMMDSGRIINDSMSSHVAMNTVKMLINSGHEVKGSRALVFGITFKEDVSDFRNSKVAEVVHHLQDFGVEVDVMDPLVESDRLEEECHIRLTEKPLGKYQAIILAVSHREYTNLSQKYFESLATDRPVFIDIRGIYRRKVTGFDYWSL